MIEQEQQWVRATVMDVAQMSFDEGIRIAAEMVRAAADNDRFLALLRVNPGAALRGLSAAIEDTTTNKPLIENPSQQAND